MLVCGCAFGPGMPVSPEELRVHFKHTIEVLLFWELIGRRAVTIDRADPPEVREAKTELLGQDSSSLSEARIALLEAVEERFPEVSRDTPSLEEEE